jgi:nucleoside-diphosphate-sugar epimerase
MRILLLGATGQIGCALADRLSRTEHALTVMVRNAKTAFPANVRVIEQREFSASAIGAALTEADHVIYGIGLPEQFTTDPGIFENVNCALLQTFLGELRKSSVRSLTYISTYEVFESVDNYIDEAAPIADESHMTPYFQSMVRAYRSMVQFAQENDIALTTIHPAAVYGGRNTGDGITEFLENLVARRWYKVPFITTTKFPVVHVDSLSGAIINSLAKPGAFIVSDQMTSLAEIARTARARMASYVPLTMPVNVTKFGVSVLEKAARLAHVKPFASSVQLEYLTKGWEPNPAKAVRELTFRPLPLADGIHRYLASAKGAATGGKTAARGSGHAGIGTLLTIVAWLQLVTGAGLLAYWPLFYFIGFAPINATASYFVFQHSFPVADIVLGLAFIRSATWLLSGDDAMVRRGRDLSLVCSGGLLFLGALDISFDFLNNMYTMLPLDTVVELAVNVWCIGFGVLSALAFAAS